VAAFDLAGGALRPSSPKGNFAGNRDAFTDQPRQPLTLSVIFLGALLFIAAEIVAFVAVAHQIGFLWALLLLIVVSALGPFIVRRVGLGVLAHTQERLGRGELPTRELLDGLVVLIAGAMICVPGFISDALGLLLMVAPLRHFVIRMVGHRLARRVQTVRPGRWNVVSVGSRPAHDETPPQRPGLPLGPGDRRAP
jgi:UPF0716 protein FxsA